MARAIGTYASCYENVVTLVTCESGHKSKVRKCGKLCLGCFLIDICNLDELMSGSIFNIAVELVSYRNTSLTTVKFKSSI